MPLERIILIILAAGGILWGIASLIYKTVASKVGDCHVEWADGYLKVSQPEFSKDERALIYFELPVKSTGKQQCIMLDLLARVHPQGDKYNCFRCRAYAYPKGNCRKDGYWEAILIKPGDTLIVAGELELSQGDPSTAEAMKQMGSIKVELLYKTYCRNRIEHHRKILTLKLNPDGIGEEESVTTTDHGQKALPVRTPLLIPGDDLFSIYEKYAKPHARDGDILAVCESALAIMEGRAYYVEEIKPGFLATRINKLFKMDSSLSSPYSLQKAIEEVGPVRIIMSVIMGALGRLVGRAGDFYAFAGRAVATIDDCTGTLPPFDKYVVMGPGNPKVSADNFKKKTGVDMAVVDVNDLGKVDVLGITCPQRADMVVDALKTNPQGNADEQTPIALIRAGEETT